MCSLSGVVMRAPDVLALSSTTAALTAMRMLRRQQNRGQEGAGMYVSRGKGVPFHGKRGMGLVNQVLPLKQCNLMPGKSAIAQTRYSTSGEKDDKDPERNLGPLLFNTKFGSIATGHNGNLKGATKKRNALIEDGALFHTSTDTEVFGHLVARSKKKTLKEAIIDALRQTPIAFSFLIMVEDRLFAVRDERGVRPLYLGERDDCYMVASETGAIENEGGRVIREVKPGELIEITNHGYSSTYFSGKPKLTPRPCIFEDVYFARPDHEFGAVYQSRFESGRILAQKHRAPNGVIVPVLVSGGPAADGYAYELGEQVTHALVRDHGGGRAFMEPTDDERNEALLIKHAVIRNLVEGKVVVLFEDSLVRGKTLMHIINLLFDAGALEVHVRIASPMIIHPCWFGIDTPTHSELFATKYPTEHEMARVLGATSIVFLTLKELIEATSRATKKKTFCTMCFDGKPEKVLGKAA